MASRDTDSRTHFVAMIATLQTYVDELNARDWPSGSNYTLYGPRCCGICAERFLGCPEHSTCHTCHTRGAVMPPGTTATPYDSRVATHEHIQMVQGFLHGAAEELIKRAAVHDQSKLSSPEKEVLDEETPRLAGSTYGSPEYGEALVRMKVMLDHHYAHNSHHPEHHKDGITGMSLFDLLEMICDWMAATKRHKDGDILKSIEINQKRFGYSDELKQIFLHTVNHISNPLLSV